MSSIFSKIVNGDLRAYKVAEDESHLAFLDVFPLAYGHVLVIPKKEIDYIFDVVICYKERKRANEIGEMKVLGEVDGKDVVIIDDMGAVLYLILV